ncbi:MAG: Holliday junction branch migration protein RuvA [Chlamydiales bacterium]|nr:Holliday junction branch migration protein RuvA [Chlamydiales bacterium]
MYSYLKGKLTQVKEGQCVIEIQGIGYQIQLSANYALKLPPTSSEVLMHVSFVIREFSQAFYGFLHESERDIFEKLLDISGVGPKLALSIVGSLSPTDLRTILANKDVAALCKVPGIGKKTAERLLLELKESNLAFIEMDTRISAKNPPLLQDAISALQNLGYSQAAAQRAVNETFETYKEPPSISELITASLSNI